MSGLDVNPGVRDEEAEYTLLVSAFSLVSKKKEGRGMGTESRQCFSFLPEQKL